MNRIRKPAIILRKWFTQIYDESTVDTIVKSNNSFIVGHAYSSKKCLKLSGKQARL